MATKWCAKTKDRSFDFFIVFQFRSDLNILDNIWMAFRFSNRAHDARVLENL